MAMCGLVKPVFRLPYVPLSREQREQGKKILDAIKQHLPGVEVGLQLLFQGRGKRGWAVHGGIAWNTLGRSQLRMGTGCAQTWPQQRAEQLAAPAVNSTDVLPASSAA